MDKRKVYTAPEVELILLVPDESIAVWDLSFENNWKNGYFKKDDVLSAVGIINGGLTDTNGETIWGSGDGFVIKTK